MVFGFHLLNRCSLAAIDLEAPVTGSGMLWVCVCVHARLCECVCVFRREVASYFVFLIKESIPGVTLATSSLGTIQSCCWTIRVLGTPS